LISERRPGDVALSLAERIEIDLAEPGEDHRVLELACRRIAGAGKRQSARVFTSLTGLQVAFRIPIKCDDDMIGHWQFQTGFKLSAEDLPVRLSGTTS
jgi:hypothetical protein